MNTDIDELHQLLLAQHETLSKKLRKETNPDNARAILTEMRELLHRIDLAQNLLFRVASTALNKSMVKVREADTALSQAISQAAKATEIVKATGEFLKFVDKALDLAKTLAVV